MTKVTNDKMAGWIAGWIAILPEQNHVLPKRNTQGIPDPTRMPLLSSHKFATDRTLFTAESGTFTWQTPQQIVKAPRYSVHDMSATMNWLSSSTLMFTIDAFFPKQNWKGWILYPPYLWTCLLFMWFQFLPNDFLWTRCPMFPRSCSWRTVVWDLEHFGVFVEKLLSEQDDDDDSSFTLGSCSRRASCFIIDQVWFRSYNYRSLWSVTIYNHLKPTREIDISVLRF